MKNPTDPEELANIFNKKHKEHMDDRFIHLIRSNAIASTPVYVTVLFPVVDVSMVLKVILSFISPSKLSTADVI